ncbi:MAG: serine hydrolase [Eubacteriales bacterium]|nr:serine hydrolase [Eubacteriales bacterium]
MKHRIRLRSITSLLVCFVMAVSLTACSGTAGKGKAADQLIPAAVERVAAEDGWQAHVTFPDWKGYTDDTLAMNSMFSFMGYHGQGTVFVKVSKKTESFRMYVNGYQVNLDDISGGDTFSVDISTVARNGENTLQISNIKPSKISGAVDVYIPYPEVLEGTPEEEGISPLALSLISDLIESDIENGFTSAQLAVIRNGRMVYENAWGKTNSYLPDGSPNPDSPDVTTDTLYDLASLTKMYSVNYALQKLVTDGEVSLDAKIVDYLGDDFVTKTKLLPKEKKEDEEDTVSGQAGTAETAEETLEFAEAAETAAIAAAETAGTAATAAETAAAEQAENTGAEADTAEKSPDLETVKAWKAELTIRDLLRHQGGFPDDPRYCAPGLYKKGLKKGDPLPVNPLFAGNGADEKTKEETVRMICRTPLIYEPGTKTVYSDVDYMVLGLIIERVSGQDLDTYMKETFYKPMGLTHITFNPLQNGFSKDDCAATELNGNTRDNLLDFEGYRTETIQGEVHDEKAYYSMGGISGHAGLFSNASDLARLASAMLTGGYGKHRFFSRNVMDLFTAPKKEDAANWGLGWWRQGDDQRVWYFGTQADSRTFGHQGWTGTLTMIDPVRNLVIVYLTNLRNTPVTDKYDDANVFDGSWYTAGTLGFVAQILSIGMDSRQDISGQLLDLTEDMAAESLKLLPEGVAADSDHPAARNARSKQQLYEKEAEALKKK